MIIAGSCKECGGEVIIVDTRLAPNFHDCKCQGCGREVSIPWGAQIVLNQPKEGKDDDQ